jgi:LemA protein
MLFALVVIAAVFLAWLVAAYNGLIAAKNQTVNALKQIDVQLKRRHDLIPNLVKSVQAAMDFEKDTLAGRHRRAQHRRRWPRRGSTRSTSPRPPRPKPQLTSSLGKLFALAEAYPALTANANMKQFQEELTSTENKVAFARQLYNDTATSYNTKQQQFPTNLVAGMANAAPPSCGRSRRPPSAPSRTSISVGEPRNGRGEMGDVRWGPAPGITLPSPISHLPSRPP